MLLHPSRSILKLRLVLSELGKGLSAGVAHVVGLEPKCPQTAINHESLRNSLGASSANVVVTEVKVLQTAIDLERLGKGPERQRRPCC